MERINNANLRLNPSKCHFIQTSIKFLGHIINSSVIQTDPENVSVLCNIENEDPTAIFHRTSKLLSSIYKGLCTYRQTFTQSDETLN